MNPNYHHPWSKKSTVDCLGSAHGSSQSRHVAKGRVFKTAWGSSLVLGDAHQLEEELQVPTETHPSLRSLNCPYELPSPSSATVPITPQRRTILASAPTVGCSSCTQPEPTCKQASPSSLLCSLLQPPALLLMLFAPGRVWEWVWVDGYFWPLVLKAHSIFARSSSSPGTPCPASSIG